MCNQTIYALPIFSPKNVKNKQKNIPFNIEKQNLIQYLELDRMDSDECCAHGKILTTTCLRIQPCYKGSMPH